MVVDSSVWVAILRDEPEARALLEAMANAPGLHLSAASYVEVGAVVDAARDPIASRRLDELLEMFHVIIEPVTASQARRACPNGTTHLDTAPRSRSGPRLTVRAGWVGGGLVAVDMDHVTRFIGAVIRSFADSRTERLWVNGTERRFPPDIARRAVRKLSAVDAATTTREFEGGASR